MVSEQVAKAMKKALKKFAETHSTTPNNIAFFIHTKPSEADPTLTPKYFYSLNGETVTENGQLKNLRFTQDILGKKFDLLGMEQIAAQFLGNYFKNTCEVHEINPKSLYIMITSSDNEAKELRLAAYNNSEVLKELNLTEVFGE